MAAASRPIDFALPDHTGGTFRLSGALRDRTVVVLFYRGDWWPYCNGQLVSCAREYEQFTERNAMLVAIAVDTPAENAAMVEKLRLPFPLLSDPDAAVIAAWDVYDPVGGTHGPIARPAIFVIGRDLSLPYEYVGRDFADRPPNPALYAAMDAVKDVAPRTLATTELAPGPRPRDAGNLADKPMPLADVAPYFRGASFGVQAMSMRTNDVAVKAECERFRVIVGDYVKATVATRRMVEGG